MKLAIHIKDKDKKHVVFILLIPLEDHRYRDLPNSTLQSSTPVQQGL